MGLSATASSLAATSALMLSTCPELRASRTRRGAVDSVSATPCRYDARRCLTHTLQKLHGPCLCLRTRRCPATSARESCPPPAARPPAPPAHSGCRPPGPAWSRPPPRPGRCRPAAAPRPALRRRRRGKGEARRVRAWWPRATRDRRNAYGHYLSRALACLAERARQFVVGGLENALGHRHRGGVRDAMACAGTVSWTGHGRPQMRFWRCDLLSAQAAACMRRQVIEELHRVQRLAPTHRRCTRASRPPWRARR
jgi:hypothetical protein